MPELPEVETTVRGLARILDGETLTRVTTHRADLRRPFPPGLAQMADQFRDYLAPNTFKAIEELGSKGSATIGDIDGVRRLLATHQLVVAAK